MLNTYERLRASYDQVLQAIEEASAGGKSFTFDFETFIQYHNEMLKIAFDDEKSLSYLQEKGLHTYEDCEAMYQRILKIVNLSEDEIDELICNAPETTPELMGYGKIYLNYMDFLVAIPHIPQSPDPTKPTLFGMYLYTFQSMLRDPRFYIPTGSESENMRMAIIEGAARSLCTYHPSPAFSPPARLDTNEHYLSFEQFTVYNAVYFSPEEILLSGNLNIFDHETMQSNIQKMNVWYNVFEPDKGRFVVETTEQKNEIRKMDNPDFYRKLNRLLSE